MRSYRSNVPEIRSEQTGCKTNFSKCKRLDRERVRIMVFGHNTNLKIGDCTFHVQTEDRGEAHALIDTTVYYKGRVLHRRTNNYFDLLPLNEDRQQALKLRLDEQHRGVIEEIRTGVLQLPIPREDSLSAAASTEAPGPATEPRKLVLELINPKSWLSGKHAKLQVLVRERNGAPISGAQVSVEIEGSENRAAISGSTGSSGQAQIEFDIPRITGAEAELVIHAEDHSAKGQLRFALRAKPRVA